MELRVLKYFLAVAREENISAAAQSLHLTQPTLSRQIKELEDELGSKLFIRGSRKITLTEEGMMLRRRAEEIMSLVGRTEKEIRRTGGNVCGDIYIGTGETDGMRQIAAIAKEIQKKHPEIYFHIVSDDASDVCDGIDKGLLDFGILLGDTDRTRYSYLRLPMKDRWGILMQKDCELAVKEAVAPEDIANKPLIMSRQTDNKSELYRWIGKNPEELNTVATYNLIYNASLMVDEGMGYAFTLDKLVNTEGTNLKFIPLCPEVELEMYLVWKNHRHFSEADELFLESIKEFIKKENIKYHNQI